MTESLDLARRLEAWLAHDDDETLREGVLDGVFAEVSNMPQMSRGWRPRTFDRLRLPLAAAGLVAALLLAFAASRLVIPPVGTPAASPSPTESPTESPAPSQTAPPLAPLVQRDCRQDPVHDGEPVPILGREVVCGHVLDLTGWQGLPAPKDLAVMQAIIGLEGGSMGAWNVIPDPAGAHRGYGAVIPATGPDLTMGPGAALYVTWYYGVPEGELEARAAEVAAKAGTLADGPRYLATNNPYWLIVSTFEAPGNPPLTVTLAQYLVLTDQGLLLASFAASQDTASLRNQARTIMDTLRTAVSSSVDDSRLYVAQSLGYSVQRPSDSGPWAEGVFPAGTCIADLCWGTFGIAVDASPTTSLDELASSIAAEHHAETGPTTLDGEPAVALVSDVTEGYVVKTFRAVVAVHAGRSYVISWSHTYDPASILSVPNSSLRPIWSAFVASFAFLE